MKQGRGRSSEQQRSRRRKETRRTSLTSRSSQSVRKFVAPRNVEQFFTLTKERQALWIDIGQIVTEVRQGSSLRQAARNFDRDPRTIQRLARPALRKLRNGRWAAKSHDKLLRVLTLSTKKGLIEIGVRDSRQATVVGEYWNAVELYLQTGDASALREFRGQYIIDARGKRIRLLTDTRELDRLASAGVLSFESFYAGAA